MALTYQKRKFAEYRVFDRLNATDAALKAGYSTTSARKQGSRLNHCPDVQRYIALLEERQRNGETAPAAAVKTAKQTAHRGAAAKVERAAEPLTTGRQAADPKQALIALMNHDDAAIRLRACQVLLPYYYTKKEADGKRKQAQNRADELSTSGRFATLANQKIQ